MHRRTLVLALLLAGCGITQAPPTTAPGSSMEPPVTPAADDALSGQIAYVGGPPDDPQIHLLDLTTGKSVQITELRADVHAKLTSSGPMRPALTCGFGPSGLAWSPDGGLLAFAYGGCDGVVYILGPDGDLRRIGDGRQPSWSPDGSSLLHGANVPWCGGPACPDAAPGVWDLQVAIIADGQPSRPVTLDGSTAGAGSPHWSPDGSLIAYSGPPPAEAGDQVFGATYLMDAGGGESRLIAVGAWPHGWHRDGRLLIGTEGDGSVDAIDTDTGERERIGPAQTSAISPDGTLVVAWTEADPETGAAGSQLMTTEGDRIAILPGGVVAWAPSSDAVAFLDPTESMLIVVDRDGNELRRFPISGSPASSGAAWRPGS